MKFYFALIAFALVSSISVAQQTEQDYIVTITGDTLHGQVLLVGAQQQTIRLRQPNQPPIDFNATQAACYGNETGALWVSRPIGAKGASRFVAPLVKGPVSLYSGENADGDKRFFLQPRDSAHVVEIPPATARLTYLRLLPGCSSFDFAYSQFERQYPYTANGQTRLIQDYNACRYPNETTTLVTTPRGAQTRFGVKAGVHTTSFSLPGLSAANQRKGQLSYQAGISMLVSTKSHLSLQTEAMYVATRGSYDLGNYYNGYAAYTTTRALAIRYSQLQVPLLLRYTLGGSKIGPYLNAGPVYSFNIQRKSEDFYQDSNKTSPTRRPLRFPAATSVGAAAGVGVLVQHQALPLLSIEARIDHLIDSCRRGPKGKTRLCNLDIKSRKLAY